MILDLALFPNVIKIYHDSNACEPSLLHSPDLSFSSDSAYHSADPPRQFSAAPFKVSAGCGIRPLEAGAVITAASEVGEIRSVAKLASRIPTRYMK
jgi:hypothetical protein